MARLAWGRLVFGLETATLPVISKTLVQDIENEIDFKKNQVFDFDSKLPIKTHYIYINPSREGGPGNGNIDDPYKSWTSVPNNLLENTAILQKAGTTETLPATFTYNPTSGNNYFGAYGTGVRPKLIKVSTAVEPPVLKNSLFYFDQRNGTSVNDLDLSVTDGVIVNFRIGNKNYENASVNNCILTTDYISSSVVGLGGNTLPSVYANTSSTNIFDGLKLKDNIFLSNTDLDYALMNNRLVGGVYFSVYSNMVNVDIYGNIFYKLPGDGLNAFAEKQRIADGVSIHCKIINNKFLEVYHSPLRNRVGTFTYNETISKINYNTFVNVGHPVVPNINAIQGQNMKDTEIAYNIIYGVDTSVADGDGIILDWAYADYSLLSERCHVHHNIITGCNSLNKKQSGGIHIYVAKDCLIYANYVYDCAVGLGLTKNQSINNKAFNNTIIGCKYGIRNQDYSAGVYTDYTLFANNIIYDTDIAVSLALNGELKSSGGNLIFKYNTLCSVPAKLQLHNLDLINVNPRINTEDLSRAYILIISSPCIKSGQAILEFQEIEYKTDEPPTIGCYQRTK